MSEKSQTNREYRDRLFKFIFGNSENKEWTLSLYNAVNDSNYQNADDIEFNTISDAVYMSMKNDVSFLINDTFNFYEQQSTYNPNIPIRFLIYIGMVYSRYVERDSYNRFSKTIQRAPTPKCICFYNGKDETEDRFQLKLTDSFEFANKSDVEVTVTMLNINYEHNKALMEACAPLNEYSWFVNEISANKTKNNTLEDAVDAALNKMPDNFRIREFLFNNKAEVKRMCITEYDEQKAFAQQRAEGIAEGQIELLIDLIKDGTVSLETAAEKMNMSKEEFTRRAAEYQNKDTIK